MKHEIFIWRIERSHSMTGRQYVNRREKYISERIAYTYVHPNSKVNILTQHRMYKIV